jgi:hypothetical protein
MAMRRRSMKAKKAMKSMKAKKAMKSMRRRAMKKKVSIKGKKHQVFSGRKVSTRGGLKKADLTRSKSGKVVSKKQSARGKKVFAKYLQGWNKAVMTARKQLGVKGFCAVGGKSSKGQALLKKARSLYRK